LKSLPTGKAAEISNMMEGFESRLLLNFSEDVLKRNEKINILKQM
jgi:hypothetical protein